MSYTKEREEFLVWWGGHNKTAYRAKELLALANKHARLAVAACNGDWPADNGKREVKACPKCEGGWHPSSYRKGLCPDCWTEQRITNHAAECGYGVSFQGDPRGYTVRVTIDGDERGVPSKE